MTLGRCTYGSAEGEGIRCLRVAEALRDIPGRDPAMMYPVCGRHAEVLDRFCELYPEWVRSEDLWYQAEYLIKDAERLVMEGHDLRPDLRDDQGRRTD